MKYILRILVLPFWLVIALIHMLYELIVKSILFIRYGGEAITYSSDDKITIFDIYQELRNDKL